MRATLSFNLPEERDEFNLANNGSLYSVVLHDIDQHLRAKLKYETLSENDYKIYEELRSKLHSLASDYGVSI